MSVFRLNRLESDKRIPKLFRVVMEEWPCPKERLFDNCPYHRGGGASVEKDGGGAFPSVPFDNPWFDRLAVDE